MDPHDAERRRQKALRLLSARLNQDKSGGEGGGAWPTLDDSPGSRTQSPLPSSHPPTHTTPLPPKSGKTVTIALPPESLELPSTPLAVPVSSSSSSSGTNSEVATATLVTIEKESTPNT
ncbi:hypothetical protein OTU49_004577 [Cherax quadricarinatus]